MFEKIFGKIKEKLTRTESTHPTSTKKSKKKSTKKNNTPKNDAKNENQEYPNRFLKFYHLNQKRLNQERRGSYTQRKKAGICVRCLRKALPKIVFCDYHQKLQKGYNAKARGKN